MKRERVEIKNADNFNDIVCDILDEFVESFTVKNGLKKKVSKNDRIEFGYEVYISWQFTKKGEYLYHKSVERFMKIGLKYFDESELSIKSSLVYWF